MKVEDVVEWWEESDFPPSMSIIGFVPRDEPSIDRKEISMLDERGKRIVICDWCNDQITEFPVPVYLGSALCKKCYNKIKDKEEELG